MKRVVGGTVAALVLVATMVAPTFAWSATPTCDHITLGKVPVGVSATLTPGLITISPPNKTTSINGTYEVPPATYLITFSDGLEINNVTVPACPSPSPSTPPSSSPSSVPSSSPSSVPSSSPSSVPSSSPSAAPSSNETPGPSPSGSSGQVLGATAHPRSTAPATDTLADPNPNELGAGLPLFVFFLVGINVGLLMILRTLSRPHRRGRQG